MRRKIITFIFCFVSVCTNAQDSTLYDLGKMAIKENIPDSLNYFHLVDSSFPCYLYKWSLDPYALHVIQSKYSDFPIEQFEKDPQPVILDWAKLNLTKARVENKSKMPRYNCGFRWNISIPYRTSNVKLDSLQRTCDICTVYVRIRNTWSKLKVKKAIEKRNEYLRSQIKVEDRDYYSISTPRIIGNYAILAFKSSHGGCSFIYKFENGKWNSIMKFGCWCY